jgi:hypothetical protein
MLKKKRDIIQLIVPASENSAIISALELQFIQQEIINKIINIESMDTSKSSTPNKTNKITGRKNTKSFNSLTQNTHSCEMWVRINKCLNEHGYIKGELFNDKNEKVEWLFKSEKGDPYKILRRAIQILINFKENETRLFRQAAPGSSLILEFICSNFTIDGQPISRKNLSDSTRKVQYIEDFEEEFLTDLQTVCS